MLRGNHECSSISRIYGAQPLFSSSPLSLPRRALPRVDYCLVISPLNPRQPPAQASTMSASAGTISSCGACSATCSTASPLLPSLTRRFSAFTAALGAPLSPVCAPAVWQALATQLVQSGSRCGAIHFFFTPAPAFPTSPESPIPLSPDVSPRNSPQPRAEGHAADHGDQAAH